MEQGKDLSSLGPVVVDRAVLGTAISVVLNQCARAPSCQCDEASRERGLSVVGRSLLPAAALSAPITMTRVHVSHPDTQNPGASLMSKCWQSQPRELSPGEWNYGRWMVWWRMRWLSPQITYKVDTLPGTFPAFVCLFCCHFCEPTFFFFPGATFERSGTWRAYVRVGTQKTNRHQLAYFTACWHHFHMSLSLETSWNLQRNKCLLMKRWMHASITRDRNCFQRKLYKSVYYKISTHRKTQEKLLYFDIWERNWCLRYKIIYT